MKVKNSEPITTRLTPQGIEVTRKGQKIISLSRNGKKYTVKNGDILTPWKLLTQDDWNNLQSGNWLPYLCTHCWNHEQHTSALHHKTTWQNMASEKKTLVSVENTRNIQQHARRIRSRGRRQITWKQFTFYLHWWCTWLHCFWFSDTYQTKNNYGTQK